MKDLVPELARMVERFSNEVVALPIPSTPTRLPSTRKDWAYGALNEELTEFFDAVTIEEEADALIDLTYFALGRLIEMGLVPGALFEEVHLKNMEKKRGELSKRPGSLGHDAIKPYGWSAPDLLPYLTITRDDLQYIMAAKSADPFQPHSDWVPGEVVELEVPKPKVLVLGYARHGKDTVCELLRDRYDLTFTSSSQFCAEHVVLPWFRSNPGTFEYKDAAACFDDRHNHRALWYDLITDYNKPDMARLGREIFASNDVYCGLRNAREFHAVKNAGLYDFAVWVDASDRVPPEDASSCTVEPWMADFVLDNNGSLEDLERNLASLMGNAIR